MGKRALGELGVDNIYPDGWGGRGSEEFVKNGKEKWQQRGTGKEDFSQDYCNRGERLNSALLKQMAGEFLSNGGSWYRNLRGRFGGVQSMGCISTLSYSQVCDSAIWVC